MFDPITIGLGLANFAVPRIAKWIAGDDGEKVANEVLDIAKAVTGKGDAQAAVDAIMADPEMLLEFQNKMQGFEIRKLEEETKRLESVNATMRAESASNDPYVRRWRPTFGYCMALTWCLQIIGTVFGMIYVVIAEAEKSAVIIVSIGQANTATVPMWAVALSVIGVSVWKRSEDKKTAAGAQGPGLGILDVIKARLAGGGGA